MKRQIFRVDAWIVDATGKYSAYAKDDKTYPITYDSMHYGNDVDRTKRKAEADASAVWAEFCNSDSGRQLQTVKLETVDGIEIFTKCVGKLAEINPPE